MFYEVITSKGERVAVKNEIKISHDNDTTQENMFTDTKGFFKHAERNKTSVPVYEKLFIIAEDAGYKLLFLVPTQECILEVEILFSSFHSSLPLSLSFFFHFLHSHPIPVHLSYSFFVLRDCIIPRKY